MSTIARILQQVSYSSGPSVPPTYGIVPRASSVNEGSAITMDVDTTFINDGTTLYWSVSHGTTQDADFSAVNGSITITNNTGSFSITTIADNLTEGSQIFSVQLRENSISGPVVAVSSNITINDTSDTYGGHLFTNTGTNTWVCPVGVTSVCVVCIGGGGTGSRQYYLTATGYGGPGGGGGGGGLAWSNNVSVVPGQSYTVVVGAGGVRSGGGSGSSDLAGVAGGVSSFDGITVRAQGGSGAVASTANSDTNGGTGGLKLNGQGGGKGGRGGNGVRNGSSPAGGGGGAGGYSGNGGDGGVAPNFSSATYGPAAPTGGGGGGGSTGTFILGGSRINGSGGGGVGIYGQGNSGGNTNVPTYNVSPATTYGGKGGSGGTTSPNVSASSYASGGLPGVYGGGSGGMSITSSVKNGGNGAVRIIWGPGRAFPSTNVSAAYSTGESLN